MSALNEPQIITYITTSKFTPVKMLLNLEDSFTPTAKIPVRKNQHQSDTTM
jgi:hypothetical protein